MRVTLNLFAKLSSNIKELRIHLCQNGEASKGVRFVKLRNSYNIFTYFESFFRDFINSSYPKLKKENPTLPILIRECQGVQPKLWVRSGKF